MTANIILIGYLALIAVTAYFLSGKFKKLSAIWLVLILSLIGTSLYQTGVYLYLGYKDKFFVIAVAVQIILSILASGLGAGLERFIARRKQAQPG